MTHSLSFDDNNGFDSASCEGGSSEPRPPSPEPGLDDDPRLSDASRPTQATDDLFEKMCSDNFNKQRDQDLDNLWNDKERQITFLSAGQDKE